MKKNQEITPEEYKALARDQWSEADFVREIMRLALQLGWRRHHCRPGRTSGGGWRTPIQGDVGLPDILLVRRGRMLAFECKVGDNKMTAAQKLWILDLSGVPGITAVCVWPSDWDYIEQLLS